MKRGLQKSVELNRDTSVSGVAGGRGSRTFRRAYPAANGLKGKSSLVRGSGYPLDGVPPFALLSTLLLWFPTGHFCVSRKTIESIRTSLPSMPCYELTPQGVNGLQKFSTTPIQRSLARKFPDSRVAEGFERIVVTCW